jgi:hypothetical protein
MNALWSICELNKAKRYNCHCTSFTKINPHDDVHRAKGGTVSPSMRTPYKEFVAEPVWAVLPKKGGSDAEMLIIAA